MSDIEKRLAALANSLGGTEEDDIMAAVAEIERLRADKAELIKKRNADEMQKMIEYWGQRAEKAEAEIERLRELVRSAYAEGFSEGMNEHTKFNGGKPWEDSRACRALEGK